MTPAEIAALIATALEALESKGIITIGGWAEQDVNAVISAIAGVIETIFASAGNGGLGGQSTPPGTDGNSSGTPAAS